MHKKIFFCAFVFIFSIKTNAQYNLVPNSSFEIYSSCPTSADQLNYASPWQNPTNWGTPDYYNSCSTTFGVPSYCNCSWVYQYPRTGNAHIGIYCYSDNYSNGREYIQVALTDSLEVGGCYYVSFYVNLANLSEAASNNIGMYFSDTSVYSLSSPLLNYLPQIKNFNNKIITDTLNWHYISGVYIATSSNKYITLGNFNDDLTTDTIKVYPGAPLTNTSYYYIDDVSVLPIDSIPGGMPAYAGVDTNVILGDSVFIGQQISNLNCNWYNAIGSLIASGTSGIYVSPTTSTYYVVEQNLCGVITYDTVNVTVLPVSIYELQNKIEVRIYPNPNNGSFIIEHNLKSENYVLEIVDLMGKVVHQEKITTQKQTITNEQLSTGLYFVNVKTVTGELMYSVKISVIH